MTDEKRINADLTFIVPGAPQAKGRHRTRVVSPKIGGKPFAMHYPDNKTATYEGTVKTFASQAMQGRPPLEGPLHIEMQFWVAPSASWPQWKIDAALKNLIAPDSGSDLDNYAKAVNDGMNSIIYADDKQITGMSLVKRYSDQPRVCVLVFKSPRVSSKITRKDQLPHPP